MNKLPAITTNLIEETLFLIKKTPAKKSVSTTKKVGTTRKPATKKKVTVKARTTKTVTKGRKQFEYVRVSENAKSSRFHEMGQKVQAGELQWAYYAIDGNVGYHYYKKLK